MCSLNAYWRKCPPVHVIAAGYVGYKPQSAQTGVRVEPSQEEMNAFGVGEKRVFISKDEYLRKKNGDLNG